MRKIMTPGRSARFALAIASISGAGPGIAQDAPKFDCARLAPLVQRLAREMSFLLPEIENTDVQTTLKGKASCALAHDNRLHAGASGPAAMDSNFDNTDGPIPNTKAWPHPLLPTAAGAARPSGPGRHRPADPASESQVRATVLWDEDRQRLVSFRPARRHYALI